MADIDKIAREPGDVAINFLNLKISTHRGRITGNNGELGASGGIARLALVN